MAVSTEDTQTLLASSNMLKSIRRSVWSSVPAKLLISLSPEEAGKESFTKPCFYRPFLNVSH